MAQINSWSTNQGLVASQGIGENTTNYIFVIKDSNVNSPEKVPLISKFLLCLSNRK